MAFKRGFNRPYFDGVYVSKDDCFVWDVKVFHKTNDEPSYILAKEYRTNEVVGPMIFEDEDFIKGIERILEEKSKIMYSKLTEK